jgi:Sulfotransferase family
MAADHRPILVTGGHRTGTTWVGRLLAAGPGIAYISEPLNVLHRPGVFGARVLQWYKYICRDNDADFYSSFRQLLDFRYHLWAELASLRSGRDLLRMGRDIGIFTKGSLFRQRALLKDPFAVFSLPWFAERLNCLIVVTIRHPAAFASSLKRLGWSFDFRDLLEQPLLMRDYLEPYRAAMEAGIQEDVIGQAGLLWAMIYKALATVRQGLASIRIVRHEDLSLDPIGGFRTLYGDLGLDFSQTAARAVARSSSPDNPGEISLGKVHSVQLDSRGNLDNWKRRLTADEIVRVRRITGEVASLYYPEEAWN